MRLPLVILIPMLAFGFVSCSRQPSTPAEAGRDFLSALQDNDFTSALGLATEDTRGILLFVEKMMESARESGDDIEVPLPLKTADIELVSSTPAEGYTELEFRAGERRFILRAYQTENGWKIRLPRESW